MKLPGGQQLGEQVMSATQLRLLRRECADELAGFFPSPIVD